MNRRQFLIGSLAGSLGALTACRFPGACLGQMTPQAAAAELPHPSDIRSLFAWDDPQVIGLTERIFQDCVLAKIKPPEGTLRRRWLLSGTGGDFYGQWIWDTMFVVDLLALLPGQEGLIRDVFQNYWDFQERWNARCPAYAHGMVACMIEPRNTTGWREYPAYTQIPLLGWGLERVYRRNGDKELLRQSLAPLEQFHEWYWRERDVADAGLVGVGAYSGVVQHARYETYDYECNLDELKLTPHPTRHGLVEENWYGDIYLPGLTAYLVLSEQSLARLAEVMGDTAMAERRKKRIEKSVAAVRRHMWDEERGTFLAVRRDSLEKVPVATIGSWIPLVAEIPTRRMVRRMAQAIQSESWQTPLPISTVDRRDKRWVPDNYWRGDVWPAPNYQIASGFARHGYAKIAAGIADKTVANALRHGVSEHYHSLTGVPLGVPNIGMCCTLVTMMLDGLSDQYRLRLKSAG